ncbi:coproporphyrinogen III oxidase-like Fe-S oxidoreductase [Catenulispora sp. EB89]
MRGPTAYAGGDAPRVLSPADLQRIFDGTVRGWNQITDECGYRHVRR